MRLRAHHRIDSAALVPVIGTSLMMVVAASGGYDEPAAEVDRATARPTDLAA